MPHLTPDADTTTIENLTPTNLKETPFSKMLEILQPHVLIQVPENVDPTNTTEMRRLDFLLARLANFHAYLQVLWAASTHERARLKRIDNDAAEDMQKKKETLYALAGATKLKYEAVSRRITVALSGEEEQSDRVDYPGRRERLEKTPFPQKTREREGGGWAGVR